MVRASRLTTSRARRDAKEHDRQHPAPAGQKFHAWAAEVRVSIDQVQALAQESVEKERALEHLLRSPYPDAAAIRSLTFDIRAHRLKIERIIDSLPALDEPVQTGDRWRRCASSE